MLDLPAGKEALLASSGLLPEEKADRRAAAGMTRRNALRRRRGVFRQTADITWLHPTAPNLAMLTVPIPADFRQVPSPQILAEVRTR
jgi:hypothetical protein